MAERQIEKKVVILGSGPAGLTAAIYAGRAQLEPLVIDGPQPGGQLTITTDVENYPGFKTGIMGPILMDEFRDQARRFGAEIIDTWIGSVDLSARPFTLYGKASEDANDITTVIKAETLIVATGASAKWLGIPAKNRCRSGLVATAFRRARRATDSFSATNRSLWSAAATPRWKRRYSD
jgi:thioredoxin reductase (NADPH)